jgi:hypothetical protein
MQEWFKSMGESFKAVCSILIIASMAGTAIAWLDESPSEAMKWTRIISPLVGVVALGVLLKAHFRKDIVPDYLYAFNGKYFNRGGFCFSINTSLVGGICYLEAYFQNQYDQPCMGRIALRPARGFWLTRANIDTVGFDILCDGAAFGIARIPVPLVKDVQGKKQSIEVGASVDYPQGKGRRLRFRDGIFLHTNSQFKNAFGTTLAIAGAATGKIVLVTPATATIILPFNAVEEIHREIQSEIRILWKHGDPPLRDHVLNSMSTIKQMNKEV